MIVIFLELNKNVWIFLQLWATLVKKSQTKKLTAKGTTSVHPPTDLQDHLNPVFFTVCDRNNLSQALTLDSSLRPFGYELLVFTEKGSFDSKHDLQVELADLRSLVEPGEWDQRKEIYDSFEFVVSFKALAAKRMMDEYPGKSHYVYCDTDIYFFQDLSVLLKSLTDVDFAFTSHFTTPLEGEKKTSELDLQNTGLYNSGFYVFRSSDNALAIFDWWANKLASYCKVDFERGMFVDQSWFNLIPLYFKNVKILHDKNLNVAYWNFHERDISFENGKWLVNGEALVFFHFSGFRLFRKDLISVHQERYSFNSFPQLKKLFSDYAEVWEDQPFHELGESKTKRYLKGVSRRIKKIRPKS